MSTIALTVYTLIWPAVVLVVMTVIARGFFKEWREARRNNKDLI